MKMHMIWMLLIVTVTTLFLCSRSTSVVQLNKSSPDEPYTVMFRASCFAELML